MLRLIDEEYTRHPFFGSRRMVQFLRNRGLRVNRKRVQRLMQQLGLAGMAPGPHTSQPHPLHPVYPYLLRGLAVQRPNQVWSTDITYLRLAQGFSYLVAILDWYSRKVLTWRLSNTLDTGFCVDCFQEAVRRFGVPEIFNTDQGAQFTSHVFLDALKAHPLQISMDGRGRAADNIFVERLWRTVKYEERLSPELRDPAGGPGRPQNVFQLLQWRARTSVPGLSNTGYRVRDRSRRWSPDHRQVWSSFRVGGIPATEGPLGPPGPHAADLLLDMKP